MFSATERAIARMRAGQSVRAAAADEGIAPSTLYRQLQRLGEAPRTRTVIVGAGALARELLGWLRRDGRTEPVAFIADAEPAAGWAHGPVAMVDGFVPAPGDEILIAIANPAQRQRQAERLGRTCASFIAASVMAGNCSIGAGSLLMPRSLVSADAVLGAFCVVNTFTSIGHDVRLGNFCTMASHVDLCGRVVVGSGVEFGSGARVLPGVRIGDGAFVGAGSVVVKDVPAGGRVFGNPARQIA